MDRLTSMAAFVRAVELGSFSAAAGAMDMSPQLLGRHIQSLEQSLGVRLLHRTTRRQHLTDVGRDFYERVKIILSEVEAADALAEETRAIPRGRLRLSCPVSFGIHRLAPALSDYLQQYPEVDIDLSMSNRYVDLIEEGFDLVFRVGELTDSSLIARALSPYRLALCAAPSYLARCTPINQPEDLIQHDCLGFSYSSLRTHWIFSGPDKAVTVPVSSRVMMDSGEALLPLCLAGLGVMLQPIELVENEIANGNLVSLLPDYPIPTRPMHLVFAPDRRMTPKLRSFIDFAVELFGGNGHE
ncbi:DNA-binding transcriptional regulator, LysR family [Cohaesibacter marisflavi]|uniref:DNA-binding transcriptional regulator, LysR family n=1 Tax=Cohaesibacter marisflavi TaxID=655353 RepID=A0A1I5N4R9_9HYPH|nr:LysR family transcriptional regulator [Cohaesibacter marisflavi]SFP16915.1 DNA-binding transcriptional regulator, LysR family [Cohaesibacter marisflavi]